MEDYNLYTDPAFLEVMQEILNEKYENQGSEYLDEEDYYNKNEELLK